MRAWTLPAEVSSWITALSQALHRRHAWRLLPLRLPPLHRIPPQRGGDLPQRRVVADRLPGAAGGAVPVTVQPARSREATLSAWTPPARQTRS